MRNRYLSALVAAVAVGIATCSSSAQSVAALRSGFQAPPDTAKPYVWWHWMNGNVTRSGITKDLKAIHDAGFGGVVLFEESDKIAPGPVRYLSPEHFRLIQFAGSECARLGLSFGLENAPGWSSSGGPWITPDQAMKHLTWSETQVAGGHVALRLPQPSTNVRPYPELGPPGRYEPNHHYYRDVAVIAFPTPKEPNWRLDDWQEKAGFRSGYHLREQTGAAPAGAVIDPRTIRVISDKMKPNGTFNWDAPAGSWTVVRFGYTLTEHANREAPTTGARGLECDKLSREAVDFHWHAFVERVLDTVDKIPGAHLSTISIDSYEVLTQTWTPKMPQEFKRLRGYDLLPYLPCLTGRAIGSIDQSERFLWDYRRTLADLMAENYYGEFAKKCHERGLSLAFEPYGYYGSFMDEFASASQADIPMGEFWAGVVKWNHWSGKLAASAADIAGRHIVGAEAYTAGNQDAAWKWHPYTLKAQGDYYFCRGVNRFYLQACVHQPWADNVRPGMTFGPHGMQMNRNNTWFGKAGAWTDYLSRCQFVLQHGQLVTDIYYDYGDNAPAAVRPVPAVTKAGPKGVPWNVDGDTRLDVWLPLPPGRDFHVGNGSVIREMHVNARGEFELPNGQRYEVLLLPDDTRMASDLLRKLAELVNAGGQVVGPRPQASPTLQPGRGEDPEYAAIVRSLWGDIDGKRVTSHRYGKGTVWYGVPLDTVLLKRVVKRDFEYRAVPAAASAHAPALDYIHRRLSDAEVYFVSNQRNEPASADCVFRDAPGAPELWNPETGRIAPATRWQRLADGRVAVRFDLDPAQSLFVVFCRQETAPEAPIVAFSRDATPVVSASTASLGWHNGTLQLTAFAPGIYRMSRADGGQATAEVYRLPHPLDLSANWHVQFPSGLGAPDQIALPRLQSLSENAADGVKYFSGTATYLKSFTLPAEFLRENHVIELDLGNVQVIAELEVNGHNEGILWKPPFRRDITAALHPGTNTIRVRVTDLWRNRLVGDAKIRGFTAADAARASDPMLAGNTSVAAKGANSGTAPASDFYTVPDWVARGEPNPDKRVVTFAMFQTLNAETPLVPSGLIGPVRLVPGTRITLTTAATAPAGVTTGIKRP